MVLLLLIGIWRQVVVRRGKIKEYRRLRGHSSKEAAALSHQQAIHDVDR
jgi:hypothetical protein